jgi:hypothetical protein
MSLNDVARTPSSTTANLPPQDLPAVVVFDHGRVPTPHPFHRVPALSSPTTASSALVACCASSVTIRRQYIDVRVCPCAPRDRSWQRQQRQQQLYQQRQQRRIYVIAGAALHSTAAAAATKPKSPQPRASSRCSPAFAHSASAPCPPAPARR